MHLRVIFETLILLLFFRIEIMRTDRHIKHGSRYFAFNEFGGPRQNKGYTCVNLGTWQSLSLDMNNRRQPGVPVTDNTCTVVARVGGHVHKARF